MLLSTKFGGELARQRDVIRAAAKKLTKDATNGKVGRKALLQSVKAVQAELARFELIEARLADTEARGV